MLGGLAAGIARYLDMDVTVIRILRPVLAFARGAAIPIYLPGWLLIPQAGGAQSLAAGWFQPRTS
jgi:phage shock protein PspC (stress-responsive transcriptional regulator)